MIEPRLSSGFASRGWRAGDEPGNHDPFGIIKGIWRYGGELMTYAIPVIDLENVQLEAVRAGTADLDAGR